MRLVIRLLTIEPLRAQTTAEWGVVFAMPLAALHESSPVRRAAPSTLGSDEPSARPVHSGGGKLDPTLHS